MSAAAQPFESTNRPTQSPTHRQGAIAPLAAVLLVFMIGLVAFAVDVSWMVHVNTELQNVADAGALAASNKLLDNYVLYQMPSMNDNEKQALLAMGVSQAMAAGRAVTAQNTAGGVSNLALTDQDIEFGYLDVNYQYTAMTDTSKYPNTVRITVRRDDVANTPLGLFFAPSMSSRKRTTDDGPLMANSLFASASKVSLARSASASINAGFVGSFHRTSASVAVLPMTLDEYVWDEFIKTGKNPYTAEARLDANKRPVLEIYSNFKDKGNFGQLSLDGEHSGNNETVNWIVSGMNSSDVGALVDKGLLPVSPTNSTWNWIGNPGFKASSVMKVNDFTGRIYLLPLFQAKNGSASDYEAGVGQGSNYYYNIRRFVGVRIMPATSSNDEIVVQPAAFSDVNAILDGVAPAPTTTSSTTYATTFTLPSLTK